MTTTAKHVSRPSPNPNTRPVGGVLLGLLLALVVPGARAGESNAGLVVPIPAAITTEVSNRLRTAVHEPRKRFEADRSRDPKNANPFTLVCDFTPDGRACNSDDFGACYNLATCLRELHREGVRTVAYVHGRVTRHAVLPVLACTHIFLAENDGTFLGQVTGPERKLDRIQRLAYEELRGKRPLAVIRKMFDPDVVLLKVWAQEIKGGDRYRDANAPGAPHGDLVRDLGAGVIGLYNFKQAREFGLCEQTPANTLETVMTTYGLSRASLQPSLEHTVAWRVVLSGALNAELRDKTERRIKRALGQKANLIILQLECGDGATEAAHELALYLLGLKDEHRDLPVQTVAYVTERARNTAVFVALACNKIIMKPEAHLGDFDRYLQEHDSLEGILRKNLAEVASRQHYPPLLAEGLVSRDLRIRAVESARRGSARQFLNDEDFDADQRGPRRWRSLEVVKDSGKCLTLNATRARELGLAQNVAGSFEELCAQEGVSPGEVRTAGSDWLDSLADFLRDPWTSVVLVMLGITCLILELKMPGVGLPGVVAAICFVLFFWSHSQLNGQITWLAVLLFVLGLLLIGLEIFVLPGFGVCGVSGILLVVGGLGLVAYGHWPHSSEEWAGLGQKVGPYGLSLIGAFAAAFFLARYLPMIPYANRLMLKPHDEIDEGEEPAPSIRPELAGLLGAIGVAATPLRPAGKTQFGDEFIDVVAEGGYVMPGTRVQVIEIEGNRVVVKEVGG
jgi:membrane-bound serine protease (ClpP class)